MPYDVTRYLDANAHIWCRVTLYPRHGDTRESRGDYLDLWGDSSTPELGCGVETVIRDLGLPDFDSDAHYLAVCAEVDRQLARRPWALLACPVGKIRLELVLPP